MYKINPKHGTLATPWGVWLAGANFIPNQNIPRDTLLEWKRKGVIVLGEDGPDVELIPISVDVLSNMSKDELLKVIVLNNLHDCPDEALRIRPRLSWTDEAIRQAIRDTILDLSTLKLPGNADAPLV